MNLGHFTFTVGEVVRPFNLVPLGHQCSFLWFNFFFFFFSFSFEANGQP
jgi:hypothetical protein